jgi:hypothetical protein
MKTLQFGIGLTLIATSLTTAAADSSITIGSVGSDIQVSASGKGSSNRISIGGASIRTGNISSHISSDGGRSSIQIGQVASLPDSDDHAINLHGHGQHARIDASDATSLCLSGAGNDITITGGEALRQITLSGTGNRLRITTLVAAATLLVDGSGNTVQLSQDSHIQVIDSGPGNRILRFK